MSNFIYSETSHTNHLYRSTTSLYRPAFYITEIKSTVSFLCCGKIDKSTTSINGPHEFTTLSGQFKQVLLYLYRIFSAPELHTHTHTHTHISFSVLSRPLPILFYLIKPNITQSTVIICMFLMLLFLLLINILPLMLFMILMLLIVGQKGASVGGVITRENRDLYITEPLCCGHLTELAILLTILGFSILWLN